MYRKEIRREFAKKGKALNEALLLITLQDRQWRLTYPGIAGFTVAMWTYYFILLFCPPGVFRNYDIQIALFATLFVPFLFGSKVLRVERDASAGIIKKPWNVAASRRAALLVTIVGFLTVTSYRWQDVGSLLARDTWIGGLWFVISAAFLGAVGTRLATLFAEYSERQKQTGAKFRHDITYRAGFQIFLGAILLLFNLTTFSYTIFHFIPAANGGGDFSYNAQIMVRVP
jgi:hypothetical protein